MVEVDRCLRPEKLLGGPGAEGEGGSRGGRGGGRPTHTKKLNNNIGR